MIETTQAGLKFILEPHYDAHGNLYFTAVSDERPYNRVNSDNRQTCGACINALKHGINYRVED